MKLLTVSHYFEGHLGGVERVAGQLARRLAATGVRVAWLATDAAAAPPPGPGLDLVAVRGWNIAERRLGLPFPIPFPSALIRIVREVHAADAVLLHDALYLPNVAAFLAARWFGRPVQVVQHIGEVPYRNPILRGLMAFANAVVARPLLARADQTVFISRITADYFSSVRFRRPPVVVFNGVDTDRFAPLADPAAKRRLRACLQLDPARPVALFVGRFVEKKGLTHLRAAARARPDILFAFAGWGPIDPAVWGLANVRVFAGLDHDAMADLYRAADVMVLPSVGEGFPLVVQEALACGLAVVCGAETLTADPAAAPLLAGVDIFADSPETTGRAVCEAVDRLLAADSPAKAAERTAFARTHYSWGEAARQHLAMLTELMPPDRPPPGQA